MKQQLNTVLMQSSLVWEDAAKNRKYFEEKIDALDTQADLVVLPEMFTTGFTNNAVQHAETMQGESVGWMLRKAAERKAVITGSLIIREHGKFYNRFVVAFPDGNLQYYDKRHLFSYAGEDTIYTAGSKQLVFEYKGFRIMPLICYDLRFPVWSRNVFDYDVLIYVANWPAQRIKAWDRLLKARGIENLSYVIGVNRVGKDANGLQYSGHSAAIDPLGEVILQFKDNQEAEKSVILDKETILETRQKLGFLNDRDTFRIQF